MYLGVFRFNDDLSDPAFILRSLTQYASANPKATPRKLWVAGDEVKHLPHVVASDIVLLLGRKPEVFNEKTGEWLQGTPRRL